MYLEHEELLVMSNTLEHERDKARGEALLLASKLRTARQILLMDTVECGLNALAAIHDPTIQYCNDIIERYTT